ncbi:hypothetical protein Cch01nite_30530 [Cellulomonas chitinilytica]|uniref:Uncharacterized protein n=1 Tax=Cellulomonas chitinilytica TaxID=398759 RepID=A0A919U3N4_9CELL|nr:hypothetical protein [Cellulomonas chitinilytica]GIG22329.1 hypothetical protein Cch01nite_30530 [Cellulomonas chitinilytica]
MLKRLLTAGVGVLGLVVVGLGIASATVWRADDVLVAESGGQSRTLVTDPGVLELGGDPVTITVRVPDKGRVVLAVGRDTDVEGWVGTDAHDRVTGLSSWDRLAVTGVEAAPTASPSPSDAAAPPADPAATPAPGEAPTEVSTVADPTGNDMWVAESQGDGSATLVWHAQPGRWSLLAVSPESAAAPTLSLAWPRVVTTPWLWPCVVVGGLLVLLSAGLLLREWLRRRAGIIGPQWRDVTTGPTPVVAPTGAGQPLTRRQLREAAAAGASGVTAPAAPRNPSGDRGSEVPAQVGTPAGARPPVPAATHADGPGLTAVTAASSRRALRTGSQPVVPAGTTSDRPADAAARPAPSPADQARASGTLSDTPAGGPSSPWGSSPVGAGPAGSPPPTPGRTQGWTPAARTTSAAPSAAAGSRPAEGSAPRPGTGSGGPTTFGPTTSRPTTSGPTTSGPATSGPAASGPATSGPGRPGGLSSGPAEHAAHGRPAWATGPIPVTRPGAPAGGPSLPTPGAVVGAPRAGAPGPGGPTTPSRGGAPGAGTSGAGASDRAPAWSAVPPRPGARSVPASGGTGGPDVPHATHRPTWLQEPPPGGAARGPSGAEPGDPAGSRGDAWRRAWGLPPLEQDAQQDTTREEDR